MYSGTTAQENWYFGMGLAKVDAHVNRQRANARRRPQGHRWSWPGLAVIIAV